MSFAMYRFALKARCNLLPTKTVAKRMGKRAENTLCRHCHQYPDSLAHILNGCTLFSGLIRDRHNSILDRVVRATNLQGVKSN